MTNTMTPPNQSTLLFSPIDLRGVTLRNRVMISPMAQYSANEGVAGDWHVVHLGKFALGGAGLVFTEATAVQEQGRITYGDLGLYKDEHVEPLRRVTTFIKQYRAVPGVQLWHAGRKASIRRAWEGGDPLDDTDAAKGEPGWETVGPSAVPGAPGGVVPRAMSLKEIEQLKLDWRAATRRALSAGFEVVEVHCAHGYLLHQFLSAMSNRRNDVYGGDLEGRMRLPLEIVEIVREVWPADLPVFVRLSASDEGDPSWTMDEVLALVSELRARRVDVIDCSSGGIGTAGVAIRGRRIPGYQVGLAEEVRRRANVMTAGVGLITRARQAEEILQNGQCDLVAIGREALHNPNWPVHAAIELQADTDFSYWPNQYGWWLDYRARTVESNDAG